ncbi:MAG: ROK family protein [Acidimicrobiales bacterium]|jgi:glucokinase
MAGGVVLGMDFGGTKIALAVCDLDGRCLAQQVLATCPGDGGGAVLGRGIAAGQALVTGIEDRYEIAAVGVSTIGIPRENGVELAPAIPGWEHVALAPAIRAAFGVPVRVATDVKAAATAEVRWGALAGSDPAIYLNLGTGLAAAIVVGGYVLEGAHGASGEIGYNLVDTSHVGLDIGSRPMLEDTVSGMGLSANGSRFLGRPVTAEQVFNGGPVDPELDTMVTALIGELSTHLVNLVIAVDPARVAIGGGMVGSWERLQGPLDQALKSGVPFPPELVLAAYPFDAPLVGALALGAEVAGVSMVQGARLSAT